MTRGPRRLTAVVCAGLILASTPAVAHAAPTPTPAPTTSERSIGDKAKDAAAGLARRAAAPVLGPIDTARSIAGGCVVPPEVESPSNTFWDTLDPGPAADGAGGSMYGRYRYAGWSQIVYQPGCTDVLTGKVAEALPGDLGRGLQYARKESGVNRAAGWLIDLTLTLIAALVFLVRAAFGQGPLWEAADAATTAIQQTLGNRVYVALIGFTFLAAGMWFVGTKRLEMSRLATYTGRFAVIVACGFLTATMHASLGPRVDQALSGGASWLMGVAVGSDADIPDAGTVVGDVLVDGVVAPAWKMQHLGYDPQVLAAYGDRLHAARTMTADEEASTAADQAARDDLLKRKEADFNAVAGEVRATSPDAYTRLAEGGKDRLLIAWLAFGVTVLVALIGGFCVVVVGLARWAWRVVISVAPGAAVLVAFPRLQPVALWAKDKLIAWTIAAGVCTVVFIAYVRAAGATVTDAPGASLWVSFCSLAILTGFLWWAWKSRDDLLRRIRAESEWDRAADVAARGRKVTAKGLKTARKKASAYINAPPKNLDDDEASTNAAATVTAGDARVTAPDAPAPEAGRVRARVTTNPGMPEARLTSGPSVTTRPDVRAFQAREAEELAVRRARAHLAGKPTRRAVTTAAVKAVPQARPLVAALTVKEVLKR